MTKLKLAAVAIAAAVLVGCGGSNDADRGTLVDTPVTLATLSAAQIDASTLASGLQGLSGKAKCDVKFVSPSTTTPLGRPATRATPRA